MSRAQERLATDITISGRLSDERGMGKLTRPPVWLDLDADLFQKHGVRKALFHVVQSVFSLRVGVFEDCGSKRGCLGPGSPIGAHLASIEHTPR
jgi:hypothetical protein